MIISLDSLRPNNNSVFETRAEVLLRQTLEGYRVNPRPLLGLGCTIAAHVINEAMRIDPGLKEVEDILISPIKATEQHLVKACEPEVLDQVFDLSRRALAKQEIEKVCLAPLRAARYLDYVWIRQRPRHEHDVLRKDGVRAITELVFPHAAEVLLRLRGAGTWESEQTTILDLAEKQIPEILRIHCQNQPAAHQ
jgi:hypothetical protein